jgi:hypothetical protein
MELVPGNSLITASPEDGRALAVLIARHTVHTIQPDSEVLTRPRSVYATDAESITSVAQVVAIEFSTIAAANNYWR